MIRFIVKSASERPPCEFWSQKSIDVHHVCISTAKHEKRDKYAIKLSHILCHCRFESIGPSGQALWCEVSTKIGGLDLRRGAVSTRGKFCKIFVTRMYFAVLMSDHFPHADEPERVDEEYI
jgi:hypothetical protein